MCGKELRTDERWIWTDSEVAKLDDPTLNVDFSSVQISKESEGREKERQSNRDNE